MKKFIQSVIAILIAFIFFGCAQNIEPKPAAIEITSLPTKINYEKGEKVSYTGLKVQMNYTDGTSSDIASNSYVITPPEGTTLDSTGANACKISSNGKTVFFTVYVNEIEENPIYSTSLEISQLPLTTSYFTNGKLDLTGLVVKMNKTDGTSEELSESEYTVEPADGTLLTEEGSQPVKITAYGKTVYFIVYVNGPVQSTGLEIVELPSTTTYFTNGKLDLTGLAVKMNKSDGTSIELTESEYTVEPSNGTTLTEEGSQPVKITAYGKTAYFTVYVGKTILTSLQITSLPNKTWYEDNEVFDTTGLEVTAVFNNGTDKQNRILEPWEYSISLKNGSSLEAGSGQKVTIYYASKTVQFVINVGSTWEIYEPEDTGDHILHDVNRGNTKLRSVTIPDTIETIESYAFYGCTALESIYIPKSVTKIERKAFYGCTSLRTIEFESSSDDNSVLNLGEEAFAYCESLKELIFQRRLDSINYQKKQFSYCISLEYIEFNYEIYNNISFDNCIALEKVDFKNHCYYGSISFNNCISLTTVNNMNCCQFFSGCTSLENIELVDGGDTIPVEAFINCTSLVNVKISNSIKNIYERAFKNCKNLESIILPDNIERISRGAFDGCSKLKLLTLPSKLVRLGLGAFFGCENLEKIMIPISVEQLDCLSWDDHGDQHYIKEMGTKIYYEGTKELFKELIIEYQWLLNGTTIYCSDGSFVFGEE